MKKYLVIGNPIEHSLSPKLHNYWIKNKDIEAIYEKKKLNNNEIEIRKLLNFCEINWDENCLKHHQSKETTKRIGFFRAFWFSRFRCFVCFYLRTFHRFFFLLLRIRPC